LEAILKKYTLEDLKDMSPEHRSQLYHNAVERRDAGGQEIIDLIDSSGLPLRSGGMRTSDPVYLKMEKIIWENRKAAIAATKKGLPALCGVEPLLKKELGNRYSPHDMGTVSAGSIIGELMRHLGYTAAGEAKCPEGGVAKTAMKWVPRK
jgi:hypothetical protein